MYDGKKNCYCVYIHTNKINGKRYIGQTCTQPNIRWKNGAGYKDSPYFYNAIQKYGWNNFDHQIVVTNLTKYEANEVEINLIKEFDTTNADKGYNLTAGGEGNLGLSPSEGTRKKISLALKGRNVGKPSGMSGKTQTEEARQKIRMAHQRQVICVDTGAIYASLKHAEEATGVRYYNISAACCKKQQTAGGFVWDYVS